MTTRWSILTTICVVLFLTSSVSAGDELPQAPPPRERAGQAKPKQGAELIIGTWYVVTRNGKPIPAQWIIALEFTPEGKFSSWIDTPQKSEEPTGGTYVLNGNTIRFSRPPSGKEVAVTWEVRIEALSGDELKTSAGPASKPERMVFKRVATK